MGRFDETILVTEERMKCAANADDPITEIALAVQDHYGCPWRAAEDVTLTVRRVMLAKGWTATRPNAAGEVRRNAVTSTGLLGDESKGE